MAMNKMFQENAHDAKKDKRVLLVDDHPAVGESRHDEESKRCGCEPQVVRAFPVKRRKPLQ